VHQHSEVIVKPKTKIVLKNINVILRQIVELNKFTSNLKLGEALQLAKIVDKLDWLVEGK